MSTSAHPPIQAKDDYAAKLAKRRELRTRNERARGEEPMRPPGPLDPSLKKHTTLLNKLRSAFLSSPPAQLIKDADGLTLEKYAEELVGAVLEGVGAARAGAGRPDVEGAVEVICHLHARLGFAFLPRLLPALLHTLAAPLASSSGPGPTASTSTAPAAGAGAATGTDKDKDERDRIARLRPVLRVVAELGLVGAWEDAQGKRRGVAAQGGGGEDAPKQGTAGAEEVFSVVQVLTTNDPQYANLALLQTFLRFYQRAYLGPSARAGAEAEADGEAEAGTATDGTEMELVPPEMQGRFRALFNDYFAAAGKTLVKGHMRLLEQDRRNHEAYIKSGEIFEDRQQAYEKMTRTVERLQGGVQSLADLLGLQAPTLPTAASLAKTSLQIVDGGSAFRPTDEYDVASGIWDDEEEKRFYEDIVDLADEVPGVLLGLSGDGGAPTAAPAADSAGQPEPEPLARVSSRTSEGPEADEGEGRLAELALEDKAELDADPDADADAEPIPSGPAARLNAIFAALPEASNRSLIDKLAVEFAFLNNKGARKRMYKFLGAVPKNRTDLLPHYARFAATLNKYMPDVGVGLIAILDEEAKYLQRKKQVKELDTVRIKNVRFYAELAKFKVAQPHSIMHLVKVLLEDLTGSNIDMAAMLLENCGRFLLRNEPTSERMKAMLDVLRRKQSTQHYDARQQLLLENAFYQCNPPARQAREQVQLTPMEAFVQHLLHDVLAKKTVDKVIRLIRKLHWEDQEVYALLHDAFTRVWEIKFSSIALLAMMLKDLERYHPDFCIEVVDQALEDVKGEMEANILEHNQRRIATLKYIGELYMYRVLSSTIVFDCLWQLVSFGHPEGLPFPGRSSAVDAVDDFFRVRLILQLLDTCGSTFDKGANKRKLDQFLVVFQLYVMCKAELPTDISFAMSDTLETIRPKLVPFKTFEEAAASVDVMLQEMGQQGDAEESASEDGSEAGGRGGESDAEDEAANGEAQGITTSLEDDDDDTNVVLREDARQREIDREAEESLRATFEAEYARMLADTADRRIDRKTAPPVFDSAVPLIRRAQNPERAAADGKHMSFALLSKKGNKQTIRTLEVPMDSALAMNTREHQLKSKQEQEQLKQLVLQNERRQDAESAAALQNTLRNRGMRLKFGPG